MSKSIRKIAEGVHKTLAERAPRARARRLSVGQIESSIKTHLRVARKIQRECPQDRLVTSVVGGCIPRVYAYTYRSAAADRFELTGRTVRDLNIDAWRGDAPIRDGGGGPRLLSYARRGEQPRGRIVYRAWGSFDPR